MTTPPPNPLPTADPAANSRPTAAGPPTKHQLALMIWLAVFPTLTVLNLALGDWLRTLTPVLRTFVLATVAVPIEDVVVGATRNGERMAVLARSEA